MWSRRKAERKLSGQFAQTTRLAIALLALRLSESPAAAEMRAELLGRFNSSSNSWGEWWISDSDHDEGFSIVPTALAIIALSIGESEVPPFAKQAAESIARHLASSAKLNDTGVLLGSLAILTANVRESDALRRARELSLRYPAAMSSPAAFIFFYEYDGLGDRAAGRDYFLAPPELLLMLCGMQRNAPAGMQLASDRIVQDLCKRAMRDGGDYNVGGDPAYTIDQAWWGLGLARFGSGANRPGFLSRIFYELRRHRAGGRFVETVWPVLALVLTASFTAALAEVGTGRSVPQFLGVVAGPIARVIPPIPHFLSVVVGPIATLIVGGIYGPETFARLLGKK